VASLVLGSGVGSKDESWSGLYQRISLGMTPSTLSNGANSLILAYFQIP
jgi:hypothetical protein